MQNGFNVVSLLRQLNAWFPGEFRSIKDSPLYAREDTTVVQATHKVSEMLFVMSNVHSQMCFALNRLLDKSQSKLFSQPTPTDTDEPSAK